MLTTSKLAIDNKRFVANVAEAAEPIITGAIKASERKTAVLADMGVVRQVVTTKADKAEVASVAEHLDAKADKTELKRIEFKADRSVVERLAEEMKSQDGEHTQCLMIWLRDIMSKANRGDVDKLSARLRATRSKVRLLEQRMNELVQPVTVAPSSDTPKSF